MFSSSKLGQLIQLSPGTQSFKVNPRDVPPPGFGGNMIVVLLNPCADDGKTDAAEHMASAIGTSNTFEVAARVTRDNRARALFSR